MEEKLVKMVLFQLSYNFGDSLNYLISLGVFDVLLPFILIFAIIFAILEKTEILGKGKTNINAIIAIVIGLLLVVQRGIVDIINLFLPRVSLIIVVILMGLLVIAMVAGKSFEGLKGGVLGIAIVLIIIAIVIAVTSPPGSFGPGFVISPGDKEVLLGLGIPLLILIIVIGVVTSGPKQQGKESFPEWLAKGFGGK